MLTQTNGVIITCQDANEIDHNLWQGSYPTHLSSMFKWIINVGYDAARSQYVCQPGQHVITTFFKDSEFEMPPDEFLNSLADTVNMLRKSGPVLVHCQAGLNRSRLITALALIRSGFSPQDAIDQVRSRRYDALFNTRFVKWLIEQGQKQTAQSSTETQVTTNPPGGLTQQKTEKD